MLRTAAPSRRNTLTTSRPLRLGPVHSNTARHACSVFLTNAGQWCSCPLTGILPRKWDNWSAMSWRAGYLLRCFQCLDTLAACTEADWFRDVRLPRELADRFYACLQKRHLISDQVVPVVLHAGSLEADLAGCPITDRGLISLRHCTRIRKLCLSSTTSGYSFSEESLLECFKCFHELQWLELVGMRGVSRSVVQLIAEQNRWLTVLNLKECENINDSCLEQLGLHCLLRSVNFSSTQITSRGIVALIRGACKWTLEEFIAERCMQIDDIGMKALMRDCTALKILSVVGSRAIPGWIARLRR
ncbi:protein AMN1 homolog isoform X2 [Amblyomma americanum]